MQVYGFDGQSQKIFNEEIDFQSNFEILSVEKQFVRLMLVPF